MAREHREIQKLSEEKIQNNDIKSKRSERIDPAVDVFDQVFVQLSYEKPT